MNALHEAIRDNDTETITSILTHTQEFTQPEAQKLLLEAVTNHNLDVARRMIKTMDCLNFLVQGSLDNWKLPILHVVITQALNQSRFPRPQVDGPKNDGHLFKEYLRFLQEMFDCGADINMTDSYGNLAVMRAVLDALNIDLGIMDAEFEEDLRSLFSLLIENGASLRKRTASRGSIREMFPNNKVLTYFPN